MATAHTRPTDSFADGTSTPLRPPAPAVPHDASASPAWRTALLVAGIASSLVFGGMIWLIRYDGYDLFAQVPSELTAVGAPTRALWARIGWLHTALLTAFGIGVWSSAGHRRSIRLAGAAILGQASLALLWPFAPMHQRDVLAAGGGTFGDTLHLVLAGVTVGLMFLAIGAGAAAFGRRFRRYSMASVVVFLVFGGLTFLEAPRLQADLPTPWIGLWERVNITTFQVWLAVFAATLVRDGAAPADTGRPRRT